MKPPAERMSRSLGVPDMSIKRWFLILVLAIGAGAAGVRADGTFRRYTPEEEQAAIGDAELTGALTLWAATLPEPAEEDGTVESQALRNLVAEVSGQNPDEDDEDNFQLSDFEEILSEDLSSFLVSEGVETDREPSEEDVATVVSYFEALTAEGGKLYLAHWRDNQMGGDGDGAYLAATRAGSAELVLMDIFVYAE